MAGQADSLKSILFALFANSAIAVAKGIAAFITGSGAMLAEAIHSVADAGNQLLLILGLRQTRKAAHRRPSPRFWQEHLLLVVPGGGDPVQPRRHVLGLRGGAQAAAPGSAELSLGRHRRAGFRHCSGRRVALGLHARGEQGAPRAQYLPMVPAQPQQRPDRRFRRGHRRPARPGVRPDRHRRHAGDRQSAVGRGRHRFHRRPADRHRRIRGGRSQGPVDRPERGANAPWTRWRDFSVPGPKSASCSAC